MKLFKCDVSKDINFQLNKYLGKISLLINKNQFIFNNKKKNQQKQQEIKSNEDEYNNKLVQNDDFIDIEDLDLSLEKESNEMVTQMQRKVLTKQGYRIVGSHSAVKLCRWTKSMLRGRGACYKNGFYGIISYSCMEATPSLACANKCTFCWRHHQNPVGTSWRWKLDDPEMIVKELINNHLQLIKNAKGMQGTLQERYLDAMKGPKHCALSLVGEPIMYPKVNEFIKLLHQRKMSTFMVTNAQFPQQLRELDPVTQLYLSVDGTEKEGLKELDRPLFKDFWERYIECMKVLQEKKQRTVFRLTLVEGKNMNDVEGYAKLAYIAHPHFIEIKGVTYSGFSENNQLTINSCPFHYEIKEFSEKLTEILNNKYSLKYDLACEHEHSNCVLIAEKSFYKNGKWHTWIDFNKFSELVEKYYSTGQEFTCYDYMKETPEWAIYNSKQKGFLPSDTKATTQEKVLKKQKYIEERKEQQQKNKMEVQ